MTEPCSATLTLKGEETEYRCVLDSGEHTDHLFDLGPRGKREFEIRTVRSDGPVATYAVEWQEW